MNKRSNEAPQPAEATSMDQVRDILFGAQLKDLETRFQRQEERFTREINDARDALKKRLDSLENFMKSENASLLNRIKEEGAERGSEIKQEQRERTEALKNEQRERSEGLKNEQRERADAFAQMSKDLASAAENFERKLTRLSDSLDNVERELRQLLIAESGSLSDKVEEKYQDALGVIAATAAQIRHDMVYRTSLSGLLHDVAVKLSSQWSGELGQMMLNEPGADPSRRGRNAKTAEEPGEPDA
jgi:DNA repair exonuclease SbcCD ATPase subunit